MSKIEILRQHVMRLYNEHLAAGMLPTSIRFLFYELVALSIISKQASGVLKPGAMACPCATVVVDAKPPPPALPAKVIRFLADAASADEVAKRLRVTSRMRCG